MLIGATPEGKKELVGFQTGVRESAQSWRELLIDIKRRGLEIAPDLAVGDGALGFWKAIEEVFPSTRHQRCWVRRALYYSCSARKVSQLPTLPAFKPVMNQRERCAEVPWVNASGTT